MYKRILTIGSSLTLKTVAYMISPGPTLLVDMQRLMINFSSNVMQMATQAHFQRTPNYKHNYGTPQAGYGKLLSFGMTLQGTLLMINGGYWLAMCMSNPMIGLPPPSPATLAFLSFGLLIEIISFGFPLDLVFPSMKLIDKVKMVKSILFRNLRTHWMLENMSTTTLLNVAAGSLPLLIQLISMLTGNIHLSESIGILASRSLGRRDVANLVRLIESRPGILRLDNLKTNYISSREVKLMAQIRFNLYYIKKSMLQNINTELDSCQLTDEERRRVESLLSNLVDLTVTHTTEVVRDMEEDLKKAFPNAKYIDLEYILSKDKKGIDDR